MLFLATLTKAKFRYVWQNMNNHSQCSLHIYTSTKQIFVSVINTCGVCYGFCCLAIYSLYIYSLIFNLNLLGILFHRLYGIFSNLKEIVQTLAFTTKYIKEFECTHYVESTTYVLNHCWSNSAWISFPSFILNYVFKIGLV